MSNFESIILAKLEESKMSNDDRVEDIETEDTLTDNLKLLNKENISNVLGTYSIRYRFLLMVPRWRS